MIKILELLLKRTDLPDDVKEDIHKCLRIEKGLRTELYRLSVAADQTIAGIAMADLEGVLVYANQAWASMHGYAEPTELIGQPLSIFHTEKQLLNEVRPFNAECLQTSSKAGEVGHRKKDGSVFYTRMTSTLVKDELGNPIGLVGTAFDITDRKRAEEELTQSEQKYRFLTERMSDLLWTIDLNFDTTYVSPSIEKVLGFTPAERLKQKVWEQITPESLARVQELMITEMLRDKEPGISPDRTIFIEVEYYHKNGSIVLMENTINGIRDEKGNLIGFHGLSKDISARKKAEAGLKKSEEQYRLLVETSPDAIVLMQTDGRLIMANHNAALRYGFLRAEELIGLDSFDFIAPEDQARSFQTIKELVDKKLKQSIEIITVKSDGTRHPVEINASVIHDENGMPTAIVVVVRDISERKRVEAELMKAKEKAEEADRLKSAFLSNMSHEIRTPLNSILGFVQQLKDETLSGKERAECLNIINTSGHQLLTLINDILDISKIEAGQFQIKVATCALKALLTDLYSVFKGQFTACGKSDVEFVLNTGISDSECHILVDEIRLRQILENLLDNAFKFTRRGKIEIGYTLNEPEKSLLFFVRDTGIGLSKSQHQTVFERFRQADESIERRFGGAGLGLAIAKGLIDLMGGKIWVESEPEKGANFYFTLPYKPAEKKKSAQEKPITFDIIYNWEQKKILIVEDDIFSFKLLEVYLKKTQATILHVEEGKMAIELCKTDPPDMILMDINLPGMSGYETVERIREFNSSVPIIAQTASAFKEDRDKCFAAGCNDYISKPIDKKIFLAMINRLL